MLFLNSFLEQLAHHLASLSIHREAKDNRFAKKVNSEGRLQIMLHRQKCCDLNKSSDSRKYSRFSKESEYSVLKRDE